MSALVCGVLLSVLFLAGRAAAQGGDWEVVRADYGVGARRVDVTDIVQRLLWEGRNSGRVGVNNQAMGGDPAVGADKTLRIFAQNRRREQREFDFREGGWIDVAVFEVRDRSTWRDDDDWGREGRPGDGDRDRGGYRGLQIMRAYYGAQGQMANITEMVRGMVRNGVMQVHVDNGSLGGDPAVGRDKVLIVVYSVAGREQATSVHEGNTMRIP